MALALVDDVRHRNAQADRRIQRRAGDASCGKATHNDARADGEAEEIFSLGLLRDGHTEYHHAEHECEHDFGESRLDPTEVSMGFQVEVLPEENAGIHCSCEDGGRKLRSCVDADVLYAEVRAFARHEDADGHSRIEVSSRHV